MIVSQTGPDRKVELKVEKDSVTITAFWAFIVGRARKAHVKEYVHLTRAEWDACVAAVAEVTQ